MGAIPTGATKYMKYNVSVYPTTQMMMGQQTHDERVEQIADALYDFMCGHRVEINDIAELARLGDDRAKAKFLDTRSKPTSLGRG